MSAGDWLLIAFTAVNLTLCVANAYLNNDSRRRLERAAEHYHLARWEREHGIT